MGARRQPLEFNITTAGVYDPTSVGWEMHERAEKVLRGEVEDPEFFAYIACADPTDDPFDEATWEKANPNYGISLKPEAVRKEAHDAQLMPSYYNTFLRYHLGIWTQQATRWIDMEKWNECGGTFDANTLAGRPCYVGLDMSNTQDITALVAVFPEDGYKVLCRFFVPDESIATRTKKDSVQYDTWARLSHITATPGGVVDRKAVTRAILQWSDEYDLRELWYDPWSAEAYCAELGEDYGVPVVACRQGFVSLNEPSKEFEKLVYSGELQHGDNPVLTWMAGHIVKREDSSGNIKPDKKESREKIDGIVALIMAVGAANKGGGGEWGIYDDSEPLVLGI
jgi:phage terminase large subunit-like protein